MKIKGLAFTAAVVLVTNGALLALVALNRSGEAEATIELTEREIRLTPGDSDNTGVVLTLAWRPSSESLRSLWSRYPWFDQAKLESVGYDCHLPLSDPKADRHYGTLRMVSRPAFVVLELGGEPWQKEVEREIAQAELARSETGTQGAGAPEAARARTDDVLARSSRLVAVDVGPDAAELRRRYPDRSRHIVTRGLVSLVFVPRSDSAAPRLVGTIDDILPDTVYVPRAFRTPGDVLSTKPDQNDWPSTMLKHDPRYRVTLAYGKALEPRVVKVEAGL